VKPRSRVLRLLPLFPCVAMVLISVALDLLLPGCRGLQQPATQTAVSLGSPFVLAVLAVPARPLPHGRHPGVSVFDALCRCSGYGFVCFFKIGWFFNAANDVKLRLSAGCRATAVVALIVCNACLGANFLLALFGISTAVMEQKCYTYMGLFFKRLISLALVLIRQLQGQEVQLYHTESLAWKGSAFASLARAVVDYLVPCRFDDNGVAHIVKDKVECWNPEVSNKVGFTQFQALFEFLCVSSRTWFRANVRNVIAQTLSQWRRGSGGNGTLSTPAVVSTTTCSLRCNGSTMSFCCLLGTPRGTSVSQPRGVNPGCI